MLAGFQNITFEFGARAIVEEATWHIQPGERIGLIGYNGTGKSTLLKLLVGEYLPSAGTVERSRTTSIGYLHQDLLSFDTNDSIIQVALGAFEKILQLEKEIEDLGIELEKTGDEKTLHEYSDKLHEMDTLDGYNIHHKTEEVLQGLGFSNADLHRPYKEFSGGWRMRVLLAKMILQQPDLLLMDEPTNHLDLPSIEWLEKYLLHYQGSVVIVSHDKYFLNRMVTKIVEVYQQQLHIYNGNYDYYEAEKTIRVEMQQKAYENQQDYIRQNERLVERFRAKASKAAMAQSIMKKLDKLDRIEEAEIERPNIRINFRVDKTPGRVLVELKNVSKAFGENVIFENSTIEIDRGDKIALIGANGKGKSTLLRIIAGVENFSEGERKWGHNVEESFYAQHQLEALNVDNTILDEMKECGSQMNDLELRGLLGCFLFSGDDSDKKIKILSGGEKARVALAKVIVSKANFLMLDEPTNHLDMHSCDLLIDSLKKYEGSMILVSHDRYFVSKTANKIWEIVDHEIKEFKGGYEEWVKWKERMAMQKKEKEGEKKSEVTPKKVEAPIPVQKPVHTAIDKEAKKELQKVQKQFQQLEEKIAQLNKKKTELESSLTDPAIYSDRSKFFEAENAYKKSGNELEQLNAEYEIVFEKIMELEKK
ncbi:MAG: ABC-F family ATP-binding cassette domain-containing protein [Chitinophagaceae bacterium]|nr:ABC-F family ATP-binding cassette domain-containing protein [Chitinophagaceae bacterium]MBP6477061.1 ABC-F family ATP-binding cassette domain-containing protein [Chitinophagaceae bacterium]MBP7108713.1 ABC-F family ATP-binding cassette domain-containing protein [Chitinophagaceae bacterium]MBP7314321.1 ABC-F family ATP-binding cassette domain-containing protein [Chitinophagaceae bacterium]HQZ50707.1 ABC-F family ATP-binding cassette domain-containing protein [Chitinophagaceae bacterium]